MKNINNYKIKPNKKQKFFSNNNYLIIILSSACFLNINNHENLCATSDMIMLKPLQQITITVSNNQKELSLTTINISKELLEQYSDESCNLNKKFSFVPNAITIIHCKNDTIMLMKNIIHKISTLTYDKITLGATILEKGLFSTFLILFLRSSIDSDKVHMAKQKKKLIIDDLFNYISNHLSDDLSLKALEEIFFISGEHISREFKKATGMNIHCYITKSRIDLAKNYIMIGKSIQDVYLLCGFTSYNHFFKVFKKECNMTPMTYYHLLERQKK